MSICPSMFWPTPFTSPRKSVHCVVDGCGLDQPRLSRGDQEGLQVGMLDEFRPKHPSHTVEFGPRPTGSHVPVVKPVRGHGEQRRRRRCHEPGLHIRLPGLAGLIGVLGGGIILTFEDDLPAI